METINRFKGKYSFLSNFYPCLVEYEGMIYPSVEHAFQAAKSLDKEIRQGFQVCPTASDAKYFGKHVKLRSDWEKIKLSVMENLVRDKFVRNVSAHVDLQNLLESTGNMYLEEGNSHGDRFWGTVNGEGRNELGKILMKIREELRFAK